MRQNRPGNVPIGIIVIAAIFLVAKVPSCSGTLEAIGNIGYHPTTTTSLPQTLNATQRASALDTIQHVTVTTPGSVPKYERSAFGPAWADVDQNGCDTRNDILARDLSKPTFRDNTHDCVVVSGRLDDPYTGRVITFTKSQATAVQIDHIFPLSAAWKMGAYAWSDDERKAFANDPINLVAVDGPQNMAKGDQLPSEWMPKNTAVACWYSAKLARVANAYDLPVTPADKMHMIAACKH